MKFERESQRYEYPLTRDSLVLDCGGYHGQFAAEIARRYDCKVVSFEPIFPDKVKAACAGLKVEVYDSGVSARPGAELFGVQDNCSGEFSTAQEQKEVFLIGLPDWIGPQQIDLLKLNIEGMEYEVLEALIDTGKINQINRIQVQFHAAGMVTEDRLRDLMARIEQTHSVEWGDEPFLWISYLRK